ncbi:MAG: DUF2752 domain-containing protein [Candidatus Eisenbacteria bacterium]|uniref:DUF2752 domain-containing protein n=1 Tax=Eiseniibacteriota bacterium TaxID=2212470 RepID=A0A7Y2H2U9_UNCEI|nr:DUF2752 domain-containing protein [Candidatus Eisenbacteria bacterium]
MQWEKASPETRSLAWLWGGVLVLSLALRPLWFMLAPLARACPLYSWTGIPCPTCGGTRSTLSFLKADLLGAFTWNPMVAILGLIFVVGGIIFPLWILAGGKVPKLPNPLPLKIRYLAVALVVLNWVYLVIHGV